MAMEARPRALAARAIDLVQIQKEFGAVRDELAALFNSVRQVEEARDEITEVARMADSISALRSELMVLQSRLESRLAQSREAEEGLARGQVVLEDIRGQVALLSGQREQWAQLLQGLTRLASEARSSEELLERLGEERIRLAQVVDALPATQAPPRAGATRALSGS